jgi:hypothetical protein
MKPEITQEVLKFVFEYRDGNLYWKFPTSTKVKMGDKLGSLSSNGYMQTTFLGTRFKVHRLVFMYHYGYLPPVVDHKDGNPLNNKIENLRACTKLQNSYNKRLYSSNRSGITGVSWNCRDKRWMARCSVGGKKYHLGYFGNVEDAKKVVEEFKLKHHGEFARI